jgi:hypothetical protein
MPWVYQARFLALPFPMGKWSGLFCSFVSIEEKVLVASSHKDNFTKLFSRKYFPRVNGLAYFAPLSVMKKKVLVALSHKDNFTKLYLGKWSSLFCSFVSDEEKRWHCHIKTMLQYFFLEKTFPGQTV